MFGVFLEGFQLGFPAGHIFIPGTGLGFFIFLPGRFRLGRRHIHLGPGRIPVLFADRFPAGRSKGILHPGQVLPGLIRLGRCLIGFGPGCFQIFCPGAVVEFVHHTLLGGDLGLEFALLDLQFIGIQPGQYLAFVHLVSFFHQLFRNPIAFPESNGYFPDIHVPVKSQFPGRLLHLIPMISIGTAADDQGSRCHQGCQFLFVL